MSSLSSRFDEAFLGKTVEAVRLSRGAWSDLFLERFHTVRVTWDSRRGTQITSGVREGCCLRVVDAGQQRLVTREGLSREAILSACRGDTAEAGPAVPEGGGGDPAGASPEDLQAAAAIEARLRALLGEIARELSGPGMSDSSPELVAEFRSREVCLAAPGRRVRSGTTCRSLVSCRLAGVQEAPAAGRGASRLEELLSAEPAAKLRRDLESRLANRSEARDAPEGEFPILLAPGTGGVFFHEACGHSLEADLVLRGASPFRGLLGERVAAPFVSAMDDATQPGLEGSYAFDDEGSDARGIVLIARGVLKAFLADRITGGRLGRGTTGSGRRESYRDAPLPRMSNAFLMAGEDDPESMLRDTRRGIHVSRLEGGSMDPATGDFRFRASSGHLIEAGRLTAPLRPFTLAGNGVAALRAIARVGSDLSFGDGTGSCGKEGQQLPVAAGLPTVLLETLAVRPG